MSHLRQVRRQARQSYSIVGSAVDLALSLRYRSYFLLYRNLETSLFYSSEHTFVFSTMIYTQVADNNDKMGRSKQRPISLL